MLSSFEFERQFAELASNAGILDPHELLAATPAQLLDNPNEIMAYWENQDLSTFIGGTGVDPIAALDAPLPRS